MPPSVFCYDPVSLDPLAKVRGVGRYLQILKENFPNWIFTNKLPIVRNALPDIFINPFFNFLQPPLVFHRLAKKQIAVIHDLIPLKYPQHFPTGLRGRVNIFLNKLALKNYDFIITDSQASKKDIIKFLNLKENKIRVIYPCLPKIFIKSSLRFKDLNLKNNSKISDLGSKFCLYVGDATWNKNLLHLARAIKIINVTCIFIGKVFENLNLKIKNIHPWQQEFIQFLKETANDKRFVFTGFLPDNQLKELYRQAEVNILISRDEGFGLSFLEAASQGCPSILSDIAVFREISGGRGAFFCNPGNPNDIANAIGEIYFNSRLRLKLADQAFQRVKFFEAKKFRQSFSKLLEN